MAFKSRKGKSGNDISVGTIRTSQLITTFGSGAIADMPEYSVVMGGIEKWDERNSEELHERSLEQMLHMRTFRKPKVKEDRGYDKAFDKSYDIPAFRFPYMHFCPECGSLRSFRSFGTYEVKDCPDCDKRLVPSRFVAACINGHLEDFPYDWWVHDGKKCEKADSGDEADLKIEFSDKSSGLESIIVTCKRCGDSRTMEGCMSKDALKGYRCQRCRPWLGDDWNQDPKPCDAIMRGLQRGASNIYFAQTQSALTVPKWAGMISRDVKEYMEKYQEYLDLDVEPEKAFQKAFKVLLAGGSYTEDDIRKAVTRQMAGDVDDEYTPQMLNEDEYRMLSAPEDQDNEDAQFHTEHTEVPAFLNEYVSDIVLVKKVREVLVLKGFRRIYPGTQQSENDDEDDDRFQGWNQAGDCIPLTDKPLGWLPGVEMKGEGIFIRMNIEKLDQWAAVHAKDYEAMSNNLRKSKMLEYKNFSPQYVMLHTLSHLLIRQLSVECGYSGAAIKERLYSTWPDSDLKMAGIFLYTSSSDSDGSLGGLVRKGLPDSMENLFRNLLQEASWCSSDPVCINSPAQGMDSLNYAACHACTLLPETCCERRNCLLDRASVVGKLDDRDRGFLSALMNR